MSEKSYFKALLFVFRRFPNIPNSFEDLHVTEKLWDQISFFKRNGSIKTGKQNKIFEENTAYVFKFTGTFRKERNGSQLYSTKKSTIFKSVLHELWKFIDE